MANINNNKVNVTMTAAQVAAVKTAIQTILANMPFLQGLSTEERIVLPKINVANKAFVEDAINACVNNTSLLPSYINIPNMQTDLTLYVQLDELLLLLRQAVEKVEDTQMIAGSEAYVSALVAYRTFGAAADASVPGADTIYDLLKQRFSNVGPSGNSSAASAG